MPETMSSCPEWHGHVAGWCVAQLTPTEEAAFVAHMAGCGRCRTEAERLTAVAAVSLTAVARAEGRASTATEPPPTDLGDRIVATVVRARRAQRGRRVAALVAVAAIVMVGGGLALTHRSEPLDGQRMALVGSAPAAADAIVASEVGGSAVVLRAEGLDPGVTYALWLTPAGGGYPGRVPAGTVRTDGDGSATARLHSALPQDDVARAWVTAPDGSVVLDTER